MKRQLEHTDEGEAFFRHPDSVEILLLSVPSPTLVALLLQLSKETRRSVWDFLSNYHKCKYPFIDAFCEELWSLRERQVSSVEKPPGMHPIFYPVHVGGQETYRPSKLSHRYVMLDDSTTQPGTALLLSQWRIHAAENTELTFDWYFVAHALILREESLILHNQKRCRLGDPSTLHDLDLCLV
jgi:hypothetical protein